LSDHAARSFIAKGLVSSSREGPANVHEQVRDQEQYLEDIRQERNSLGSAAEPIACQSKACVPKLLAAEDRSTISSSIET
jgi:hypothetical protein